MGLLSSPNDPPDCLLATFVFPGQLTIGRICCDFHHLATSHPTDLIVHFIHGLQQLLQLLIKCYWFHGVAREG